MQDDSLEQSTPETDAVDSTAPETTAEASATPDEEQAAQPETTPADEAAAEAEEPAPIPEGAILVDGLIFDLDGTLVDSREDLAASVNALRESREMAPLEVASIVEHIGNGVYNLVSKTLDMAADDESLEGAVEAFREHYAEHCLDKTQPYPGALEILEHFKDKPCAVVSNKPEEFCRKILNGLGLDGNLMAIIGGDTVEEQKPHPMPMQEALDLMGVEPANVVVIGDHLNDIESGRQAGTKTCAVTFGLGDPEKLRAASPDYVVEELGALVQVFA